MPAWLAPAIMGGVSLLGGLFGNKSANKNNTLVNNELNRWNSQFSPFMSSLQGQYGAATDRANQSYNDIYGRYTDMLGDNEARDFFSNYSQTGGWNPADFQRIAQSLRNPISEEDKARMRGGGVFDEMARTGGYSDEDIRNVRARTASQTPAFFDSLKNRLNQTNTVQGGFSPGYGSQMRALARDSARGGVEAVRDTEIGLQDSIRSGKLAGAQGMASSEGALQQLLMQALGMETGLYSDQARNKLAGGQGLLADSANKQNMLQGLMSLRSTPDANQSMFLQALMNGFGMDSQYRSSLLGSQMNNNNNKWNMFTQLLGAFGPAFMTSMGGGGGAKGPGYNAGGF